jgi:dipeptidyl aminopeptidase/acylaminoacyl peptidase
MVTQNTWGDFSPTWSPDGSEIAFSRCDSMCEDYDIFSVRSDGSDLARLTSGVEEDLDPAWSPDGSKIAFERYLASGSAIVIMNSDGTEQTRLIGDIQGDGTPDWSPDGTRIAFWREEAFGADAHIWLMKPDGTQLVQLTSGAQADWGPSWSSDGERIAFTRQDYPPVFPPPAPPPPGPPPVPPPPAPPTPVRCHVPRVIGLRMPKARTRIRKAKCAVGAVRRAHSERIGRVLSQKPSAGKLRARGTKVRLVVGRR